MKTHLGITISEPCHEDWHKMTPTEKGRHCNSCKKEVIDFTTFTKKEIHSHITKGGTICGRFRKDQLDAPLYLQPSKTRYWKKYAASLLFPAALFVTDESFAQGEPYLYHTKEATPTEHVGRKYDSLGVGSLSRKRNSSSPSTIIKGKVTTSQNNLFGASVVIKGTGRYTSTGNDGSYTIEVSEGEILVFNFLGYMSQEIVYKDQSSINVCLEEIEDIPFDNSFIMGGPQIIPNNKK